MVSASPKRAAKEERTNHIKQPLNAFILYSKAQRARVRAEPGMEHTAINLLAEKWHSLDRAEKCRYYALAEQERKKHAQTYPGCSAKDNYARYDCQCEKRIWKKEKHDGYRRMERSVHHWCHILLLYHLERRNAGAHRRKRNQTTSKSR
ncbi:transcription factor 7-like [Paramacrobiotus metropolitanus]|uniref:transcription factor 7-like n=1 Tax=Paramacrobiotus metropolitanus TaxID=2943436 RepID=UPI00244579DF|nr:transcription factor 7-like [Paramacrobiotus metropolitanus]